MKRLLYSTVAVISLISGTYLLAVYYAPSDPIQKREEQSLVDFIKRQSNLTQHDVDKWKALFLGTDGPWLSFLLTGYGAAVVGGYVGQIMIPENSRWLARFVWSAVPVGVTYKLVFPVLLSRTEVGVAAKLGELQSLCKSLVIATYQEYSLDNLEYHIEPSWKNKGEIAWCLAIDNLIEQCGYAIDLCGQLASWGRYSSWADTFYDFAANLKHNRALLEPMYDAEMARRGASDLPFRNGTFY